MPKEPIPYDGQFDKRLEDAEAADARALVGVGPQTTEVGYWESDSWNLPSESILQARPPLLKLAQGTTRNRPEGCQVGWFFNTVTGESFETIKVLLVDIGLRKSLWSKYDPSAQRPQPICCSDDGITPSSRGTDPLPGPCRAWVTDHRGVRSLHDHCPKAQWTGPKTGRTPPECPDDFVLVLWLVDFSYPVLFTTKRKGSQAVSKARQELELSKFTMTDRTHPEIPIRLLVPFELSSHDEGTYRTPKFTMLRGKDVRIPIEYAMQIHKLYADLRQQAALATAEEINDAEVLS